MMRISRTAALLVLLAALPVAASDHDDGSRARALPAANITNLLAWNGDDTVRLVMTVWPDAPADARFAPDVQYVFHTASRNTVDFLVPDAAALDVVCIFDAAETVQCWAGDQAYVTGDARGESGVVSADGRLRVFTGRRDDPFFFNRRGFEAAAGLVAATGGAQRDAAGCPAVDAATSQAILVQLRSAPGGGEPSDDFAGRDALAIVVEIDRALVTAGGPVVAVRASTRVRP